MSDASGAINWRLRGRVLMVLLCGAAAAAALLAAINAHLAPLVTEIARDPHAYVTPGQLAYCPHGVAAPIAETKAGEDRSCCLQPAAWACLNAMRVASESAAEVSGLRQVEGDRTSSIGPVQHLWAWLAVDVAFAVLYTTLVVLACLWAPRLYELPMWCGVLFAAIAVAAGLADIVEDAALMVALHGSAQSSAPAYAAHAQWLAQACWYVKWAIVVPIVALAVGLVVCQPDLFWRQLSYFAVLRPTFIFTAVLLYLPLTAIESMPLSSTLGNLLVDYDFGRAFWLGLLLFPTVWSVMFTACLILDSERKRDDRWVFTPAESDRTITLPIRDWWIFFAFSAIALPTVVVVAATALAVAPALAGMLLGGLAAFAALDLSLSIRWREGQNLVALPWRPLAGRLFSQPLVRACEWLTEWFRRVASRGARLIGMPKTLFAAADPTLLEDDHAFAAWSLTVLLLLYAASSVALSRIVLAGDFGLIYDLPPAGFLYVLLVWLVWMVSLVWFLFRRYRLALAFVILAMLAVYGISRAKGASYTFDPIRTDVEPLTPGDVVSPLHDDDPIIIVAASGGGIAAAGWTAKVLAELREHIPDFDRKLRLLSTVSGGSVGSAHYLHAFAKNPSPDAGALSRVVAESMDTSLSATAYGFAFPELHRLLIPFFAGENSDRGRLQERTWKWRANCAEPTGVEPLSALADGVKAGTRPAVIFNTTLMETGGRVAVGNVASFEVQGDGASATALRVKRLSNPRSLPEFLSDGKSDSGWTVDMWTGARLSATFSYVSPAAAVDGDGASFPDAAHRHLIDGGYHDNFGVATALDWLQQPETIAALRKRRVAFVEIRASPQAESQTPASGLVAEWLGPVMGMWNSWWRSQTETNDTALRALERASTNFATFLFVPVHDPPLSWHLSRSQKERICGAWKDPHSDNPQQLKNLLGYLGVSTPTDTELVDCTFSDPCGH